MRTKKKHKEKCTYMHMCLVSRVYVHVHTHVCMYVCYITIIPAVMNSWLRETSLPLNDFGANSALYTGTIILRILMEGNHLKQLLNTCALK